MATQPSDFTEFPPEIILKPLALIGLSGLDTINNAVHRTIWEAFSSNRRADRVAVRFKLLNNTFEFPIVKPKRNSYEWYIPKGILKKNWINKRINLIPAVVVIFYDMEWNDPQWNEKIIECASRVQSIRAAVEGHATRLAVVVIQSGLSPPPSEYMLGAERAQALCSACEIQSKALFVLPHNDHLIGYVLRLENAFYDIAQNYYHHETKNIKQHRDHLNKTTHQYLFIRHQFKLGFLNELKQDLSVAHKHYLHAYNNLSETRIVDTNVHEVRTVAGYINYKLCKLLFALNLPRDSIAQLKSHIERYKSKIGPSDLLFEHYAWIARQYSAFGELFDEAIRSGLPAIQSQHPGFYYQQAAQFTVKRRQTIKSVCSEDLEYPLGPDPLEGLIEFYGQRSWRPGRISADPHDPQKEQMAILALQYLEKKFNHSAVIISFLGSAISQFKTFHSPRMRKQLVVEMANEYYLCSDYGKALTLLTHMLWDYRREKWWFLASYVLNRALQCAYLSAKVQDYLQLSIEALSKYIQVANNDKDRIFQNISAILNSNVPNPEPDIPVSAHNKAIELWQQMIDKEPLTVSVEMINISSFIEVKTKFKELKYRLGEVVEIVLFVRLNYSASLKVKNIYVTISSHTEIIKIPVTESLKSMIHLEGGKVNKFLCQFKPSAQDIDTDLHVKNVSFLLDSESKRKLVLNFKLEDTSQITVHPELLHFILSPKNDYEFDSFVTSTVARIISRECKLSLTVNNECPALQGEWFLTTFTITNNEDFDIQNVKVVLTILSTPDNPNPESVTELCLVDDESCAQSLHVDIGTVALGSNFMNSFCMKSNRISTTTIQIKTTYILNTSEMSNLECTKDFKIKIPVVKPFEVSAQFVSMKFKKIPKCFVNDPFVVLPQIKILSPWELVIEDTDLEIMDCYEYSDSEKPVSCISNLNVTQGHTAVDAVCIQAKYIPKDIPTRVGLYNIKWRRKTASHNNKCVMSSTALAGLPIDMCPVSVKANHPEIVELQTSVPFQCIMEATVDTPTRLNLSVEGTDSFMFSGYKKVAITVSPHDKRELWYNIHPLVAGVTNLPNLKPIVDAEKSEGENIIKEIFDQSLPHNVFVMPKYNK